MDLKQTIIMLLHDVVAKVFDIASELNIHVRRYRDKLPVMSQTIQPQAHVLRFHIQKHTYSHRNSQPRHIE